MIIHFLSSITSTNFLDGVMPAMISVNYKASQGSRS